MEIYLGWLDPEKKKCDKPSISHETVIFLSSQSFMAGPVPGKPVAVKVQRPDVTQFEAVKLSAGCIAWEIIGFLGKIMG